MSLLETYLKVNASRVQLSGVNQIRNPGSPKTLNRGGCSLNKRLWIKDFRVRVEGTINFPSVLLPLTSFLVLSVIRRQLGDWRSLTMFSAHYQHVISNIIVFSLPLPFSSSFYPTFSVFSKSLTETRHIIIIFSRKPARGLGGKENIRHKK